MAGTLKPNGGKSEVGYIIHGYNLYDPAENLFNGSMTGVYSGTYGGTSQRKTTARTYWASGIGASLNYLDIEFLDDVKIWDAGGNTAPNQTSPLDIYKNDNGTKGILFGQLAQYGQAYNADAPNWQIVATIPKGRYRIESDGSATRISNEWYLEKASATNKTLILSSGEYKKWNENADVQLTSKINPIMTSNIAPSPYVASASSVYSTTFEPFKAFNEDFATSGATATGWVSSNGTTTGYLTLDFGIATKVGGFKISPRNNSSDGIYNAPKDFKLQGSDDGVNYVDIKTFSNQVNWTLTEQREFKLDRLANYRYYRLSVQSITGGGSYTYIAIGELQYFGGIDGSPAQWITVSPTLPTSTQFLSDGMDMLNPLIDRTVLELDTMDMEDKTDILFGVGATGKVYQQTLDLGKYIDIRSLKVEVK